MTGRKYNVRRRVIRGTREEASHAVETTASDMEGAVLAGTGHQSLVLFNFFSFPSQDSGMVYKYLHPVN
jgi:hypothetical protein